MLMVVWYPFKTWNFFHHVDGSSSSISLCKSLQSMVFSPYQDPGLLGVGKSVPERFSVRMWGRGPIPIEKQFGG